MSELKSSTAVLGPGVGSFLKWEATPLTRVAVPAASGTKAGEFVVFPLRGDKYIALTDEENGKVIIQPHNCVIDLSLISAAAINDAYDGTEESPVSAGDLSTRMDVYGIVFIGSPTV